MSKIPIPIFAIFMQIIFLILLLEKSSSQLIIAFNFKIDKKDIIIL